LDSTLRITLNPDIAMPKLFIIFPKLCLKI